MPLWIELMVALLIVYGAVVSLAMLWFSRRVRMTQLLQLRQARELMRRAMMQDDTPIERKDMSDG